MEQACGCHRTGQMLPSRALRSLHSRSNRARYLRSRSASFASFFRSRERSNSARPAAERLAAPSQTCRTSSSCTRSKRSSSDDWPGDRRRSTRAGADRADGAVHASLRCAISAFTWSIVMRPAGASVASRVIAAFKSRKLPGQSAARLVANARNSSRASLLNVTAVPVLRLNWSSS